MNSAAYKNRRGGASMRARFLGPCVALALLAGMAGASPQSTHSKSSPRITALKAKARSGNADSQFELGVLYENGEDVPQDFKQAVIWYRKAAEQGDSDAQYSLGFAYCYGQGIPRDFSQASEWFRKAAEQGHAKAQHLLGVLYRDGDGVPQDYVQAATWTRKAAEQNNAEAQYFLGILYRHGEGVPQDYAEAYFWFDIAAAGKLDVADVGGDVGDRDQVASRLTPAEISLEQERAHKWLEDHSSNP
jgi:uncharacterized protein